MKEFINLLAQQYVTERSKEISERIYLSVAVLWRITLNPVTEKKKEDLSIFNETFCLALNVFTGGDFVNFLSRSYKNARINAAKRHFREMNMLVIEDETEEDTREGFIETIPDKNDRIVSFEKEADQRQLIDYLLRAAKPDATTTAIVEAYLSAPPSAKPAAIAKSLGLHHEVAKRKLRALSRHYDANRFGDYRNYLVV